MHRFVRGGVPAFALALSLSALACGNDSNSSQFSALADQARRDAYPTSPDLTLTPGELCDRPTERRYQERIAYCERNVDSSTKWEIIRTYDARFGYRIESMNRMDFKIDHFIPLCMGGSNNRANLWPQYKSVYMQTDPLEQELCQLMAAGKMRQAEAVDIIRTTKTDLGRVASVRRSLEGR